MQAGARPISQPPAPTDLAGDANQLRSGMLVQKMDGSSDQPLSVSKSGRTSGPPGLEPMQSPRRCVSEEDQNGSPKADVKILARIQGVRTKRSMANLIVSSRPSCSKRCLKMVNGWLTCLNDNPPPLRPGPIEVRPHVGAALAQHIKRASISRWSETRRGFNRKLGYPPLGLAQAIRQPHHKEQAAASACSWTARPRRLPAVSRRGR